MKPTYFTATVLEVKIPNQAENRSNFPLEVEINPVTDSAIKISTKSKNIKKKVKDTKTLNKKTTSHQTVTKRSNRSDKKARVTSTRTSILDRVLPKIPGDRKRMNTSTKSKCRYKEIICEVFSSRLVIELFTTSISLFFQQPI